MREVRGKMKDASLRFLEPWCLCGYLRRHCHEDARAQRVHKDFLRLHFAQLTKGYRIKQEVKKMNELDLKTMFRVNKNRESVNRIFLRKINNYFLGKTVKSEIINLKSEIKMPFQNAIFAILKKPFLAP